MNHGAGVGVNTVTPGGTDFTISETVNGATVQVPVSIAGDSTVGDVINSINAAAQAAGATSSAQLATSGNGIELTDSANGPIVVTASTRARRPSTWDWFPRARLPRPRRPSTTACGTERPVTNSELFFQAVNPGTAGNVQVVFQANAGITAGNETVQYDPAAKTLTFQISPQTTANDIIAALKNPTASAAFTASLDTSSDPTNNGNGIVQPQQIR